MGLAAEDFEELIDSMGLTGTAAANLDSILTRLAATQRAEQAATKAAAAAGVSAAQMKAALAAANREAAEAAAAAARTAAEAERQLAAEQKAAAKAAEEAASAARKLADERARQAVESAKAAADLAKEQTKAAEAAQNKAAKADVDAFRERERMRTQEKAWARQRTETTEWFTEISKGGGEAATSLDDIKEQVAGITAEYAAAIAIVTAYATALYALGDAAIRFTQEKQALAATFDVFTGGAGAELLDILGEMAEELPFTGGQLEAWAKSMAGAVGTGQELKDAIRAVAAATAIMGTSGGAAAEGLIKRFALMAETGQKVKLDRKILGQLAEAGVSVKALAAALGVAPEKLGEMSLKADELSRAMQKALVQNGAKSLALMGDTWASISAKLTEGWEEAFEDLGDIVNPFMAQLRSLASEFFAGSIASKGTAGAVRGVLTPAFEIATRTVRAMHIAFLEAQIAYLKASIALRPLTSALDKIGISGGIVNVVMYLIAGTAVVLAVVFGALALAVFLVALPFILAAVAIYGVVTAIGALIDLVGGAIANLDNLSNAASAAGTSIIQGLGNAIASGAAWVVGLVKGLASSIIGAITGPLQIASPSRVMKRLGGHITEGLAGGVDDGAEDVESAAEGAAGAAVGGVRRGTKKAGGRGGGKIAESITINFYGSASEFDEFREKAEKWLEELGASGPEPEPA